MECRNRLGFGVILAPVPVIAVGKVRFIRWLLAQQIAAPIALGFTHRAKNERLVCVASFVVPLRFRDAVERIVSALLVKRHVSSRL